MTATPFLDFVHRVNRWRANATDGRYLIAIMPDGLRSIWTRQGCIGHTHTTAAAHRIIRLHQPTQEHTNA